MTTVGDLLAPRSHLLSVSPHETVAAAIDKAIAHDVSALPVLVGGRLAGIVTERDFVRRVLACRADPLSTSVEKVMTRKLVTMSRDNEVEQCMALMIRLRIRHMLVTGQGELLGILSIRDMVQQVLREKRFEIARLRGYISGSY